MYTSSVSLICAIAISTVLFTSCQQAAKGIRHEAAPQTLYDSIGKSKLELDIEDLVDSIRKSAQRATNFQVNDEEDNWI